MGECVIDLIHDFDEEVSAVLEQCERIVASYPPRLKEEGHQHLEKLHLLKDQNQSGGFCYLMPFWLRDSLGLGDEACRIIALGNVFGLLYFMSQDEIMDYGMGELLPLSNLFYLDFIAQYRSLFPSKSTFWSYFNEYVVEWSNSLSWERAEHFYRFTSYTEEDLILLSRKAAPMKIPFTAICLLTEKISLIPHFCSMVDYDQAAFQMIDDWRDWQEDIENGNCTFILSRVMEYCQLEDLTQLDSSHFLKAVFIGDVGEKVLGIAKKYNRLTIESIRTIDSPYLDAYTKLVEGILDQITERIEDEKNIRLEGGLNNLLRKLTNQ